MTTVFLQQSFYRQLHYDKLLAATSHQIPSAPEPHNIVLKQLIKLFQQVVFAICYWTICIVIKVGPRYLGLHNASGYAFVIPPLLYSFCNIYSVIYRIFVNNFFFEKVKAMQSLFFPTKTISQTRSIKKKKKQYFLEFQTWLGLFAGYSIRI